MSATAYVAWGALALSLVNTYAALTKRGRDRQDELRREVREEVEPMREPMRLVRDPLGEGEPMPYLPEAMRTHGVRLCALADRIRDDDLARLVRTLGDDFQTTLIDVTTAVNLDRARHDDADAAKRHGPASATALESFRRTDEEMAAVLRELDRLDRGWFKRHNRAG